MNAGQKIEIEVTLMDYNAKRSIDKHGWVKSITRDYTFKGTDGITYTFHTTGINQFYGVNIGETITMKATVKEVTETETKLIRCRKAK